MALSYRSRVLTGLSGSLIELRRLAGSPAFRLLVHRGDVHRHPARRAPLQQGKNDASQERFRTASLMGDVIRFPIEDRCDDYAVRGPATVTILPVIRIERTMDLPFLPPPEPKRTRRKPR